jgi:hypothetical protein
MEWFTLFWPGPEPKVRAPQKLFTCGDGGTHCVCTLGPEDYVFVGRGKKKPLLVDAWRTGPVILMRDSYGGLKKLRGKT